MCDCPSDKNTDGSMKTDTVTLFQKCPKPYRPGQNIELYAKGNNLKNGKDQDHIPFEIVQDSDVGCYDLTDLQTPSECTTESSRMYKFVNPHIYDIYEDAGEAEAEPDFIFEPCMYPEEVEDEPDIEHTLAIIKPEAMIYRRQIERRIYEEGFEIRQTRWLQLTPEQASEFYTDNYGQLWFAHLVAYMSSAPIIALVLAKHNAINDWKFIMGPTKVAEARLYFPDSVRAKYGRRGDEMKNAVHGSTNREDAEREIHFFFPDSIIEPLLKGMSLVEYLYETINPVLTEGLTMCCKLKPADPLLWLAHWLILNNPNKPRLPENLALVST